MVQALRRGMASSVTSQGLGLARGFMSPGRLLYFEKVKAPLHSEVCVITRPYKFAAQTHPACVRPHLLMLAPLGCPARRSCPVPLSAAVYSPHQVSCKTKLPRPAAAVYTPRWMANEELQAEGLVVGTRMFKLQ